MADSGENQVKIALNNISVRWTMPEPLKRFCGVRDAVDFAPSCLTGIK